MTLKQQFPIGTRVEMIKDFGRAKIGLKGIVKHFVSKAQIGIKFDLFMDGHNLDSRIEQGYGYYVTEDCIKKINSEIMYEIY